MSVLIKSVLFFSFWVSLAIFNTSAIGSGLGWGLTFSWFLGIFVLALMAIWLSIYPQIKINKKLYAFLFGISYIIFSMLLSSLLLSTGTITLGSDADLNGIRYRAVAHSLYLVYFFCLAIAIYIYFQKTQKFDLVEKYFIAYPSVCILIVGLYGFMATFGLVPVDSWIHNNFSTGYTFERFKHAHRSASVFPEPSHYAAYLAFLLPTMYAYSRKMYEIYSYRWRVPIIVLYISQILIVQSLSLYFVLPLLLIIVLSAFHGLGFFKKHAAKLLFSLAAVMIVISAFMAERVIEVVVGLDGSFAIRLEAFYLSLSFFFDSPIIGIGYGAIRGIDGLSTLLATIGVLGISVLYCCLRTISKHLNDIQRIMYLGFICMFIVSLVADNMMSYLHFWVVISILLVDDHRSSLSRKCRNLRAVSV